MRPTLVISLAALISFTSTRGSAQTLQTFEDLALRINLDDQVRVRDRSGAHVTGRLTRLTRDSITILTRAGEKQFTSDAVGAVDVRDHALGKGALVGAASFAVLGAVAGNGSVSGAAAIGAGLGAAIGSVVPTRRTIFRASESGASVRGPREGVGAGPDLLNELGPRINVDDRIRIEDQTGVRTTGRVTHLTADTITIETSAGDRRFTGEALREVAVRRSPVRLMTLVGAGAGVVAGALLECRGEPQSECPDGVMILGGLGAGCGAITGALIQRTTIVYARPGRMPVVVPTISRHGIGIQAGLFW